jgi:hypothetical protein
MDAEQSLRLSVARHSVYRRVFDWFTPTMRAAFQSANSPEEIPAVERRAGTEWNELFGLPPLETLDDWHAAALAAGFSQSECVGTPFWKLVRGIIGWAILGVRRKETSTESRPRAIRRRAAGKSPRPRPLTSRQTEVIQVVGECKGNLAAAAQRLGRDRKTIKEIYQAGMSKLGKDVTYRKKSDRLIARDRRGQVDVSDIEERRLDEDEELDAARRKFRRR